MNKLEQLRSQIDEIDAKLVALLKERFAVVKKIGEYKKENQLPILDKNREALVLASKKSLVNEKDWPHFEKIFQLIMDLSKDLEK